MGQERDLPSGPPAAAMVASGIGVLALGFITTLSEAVSAVSQALNLYNPVGPLSGKTIFTVIVWLIAWIVLHSLWKNRNMDVGGSLVVTLILIALGILGTFPPFFELFISG